MKEQKVIEINEGIKLHIINRDTFKTDLTCITLTVPLTREIVTKNALIPLMLRRGTTKFQSQYEINRALENMYGANLNAALKHVGDSIMHEYYIDSLDNEYALDNENILEENLNMLLDVVFNPILKDGKLNEEFLNIEKDNLKILINSKKDDKDSYAYNNCISCMYHEEGFGLYKYGYEEDVDSITIDEITDYYYWFIDNAKIDIFVSGKINEEYLENYIRNNELIKKLKGRKETYVSSDDTVDTKESVDSEKVIFESMDITQGKLVIGLDIHSVQPNLRAIELMYNSLLGESASSLLFQNVREKASLAYTAKSNLVAVKRNVFIRCGINIEDYDEALKLIREQLEIIKNGAFSDDEFDDAKMSIISGLDILMEEQTSEILYFIAREYSDKDKKFEEYISDIMKVTREDVIELAKTVNINTIYFLKN